MRRKNLLLQARADVQIAEMRRDNAVTAHQMLGIPRTARVVKDASRTLTEARAHLLMLQTKAIVRGPMIPSSTSSLRPAT